MNPQKPNTRPHNPCFSSGPCAKHADFAFDRLKGASLGRSHRRGVAREKLRQAITRTHKLLKLPPDYRLAIVPASDTGAMEMAMWSMLGARHATITAWEHFGQEWVVDVAEQLKIGAEIVSVPYGAIADMDALDYDGDVVFTWNGTSAGVRLPHGTRLPADRKGLTICDATSAVFAMDLPWQDLDVATFSWQKVMGGEAGHGMLVLSPRAVERLESYTPPWPVPKLFRLTKNGKLNDALFDGETINTPSMLAVEDYLTALDWADSIGGLDALIARADANARQIWDFCDARDWIENLAKDQSTRSTTSVCLRFTDPKINAESCAQRLADAGVAYDINAYRTAPPGLRIWCGSTVEARDIRALLPWIEWAYLMEDSRALRASPTRQPHPLINS